MDAKFRMYEFKPFPGCRPTLILPKMSSKIRHLHPVGQGWRGGPEQYGPEHDIQMFEVKDADQAIRQLEVYTRLRPDVSLVYYVIRGRRSMVGAVAISEKLPFSYAPRSAPRPYLH